MKVSRVFYAGLLILAGSGAASGKSSDCQRPIASVSILDGRGLPVTGLQLGDLRVEVGGKPATIVSAIEDHSPRRIVVLLEASRAVRGTGNGEWKLALQLAIDAFAKAPQETQMALVIFSKKVDRVVDFDSGRSAALALLGELRAGSQSLEAEGHGVHFLDSILEGLKLFRGRRFGDAIYGIISGYDSGSKASVHDVEVAVSEAQVRVFLSGLFPSATPQSGVDIYREALPASVAPPPGKGPLPVPSWVQASGGNLPTIHSVVRGLSETYEFDEEQKKNLATSLSILYREMLETYRLNLELSSPLKKPEEWKPHLAESVSRQHRDWQILFTSTLVSCKSDSGPN
jgi:hypothetical protein